ncbi:MAG: MFS transporter, partial [Anaerolineales bacterium]|nr:MFS transporter [Anaerolineales bacterium]
LQPPIYILAASVLITSMGAGTLNPIIGAVEFERIPPDMRGRVFGAVTAGAWMAMPFGMLLGGLLTEKFSYLPMLIALGITYFFTTISMAFIPAMKEMNRKVQAAAD